MNSTPALSTANIVASPTTTFLGLATLAQGAAGLIGAQGLPTSTPGWVVFGLSILGGLFGVLGKG